VSADHQKPTVAFWTTAMLVGLVLLPMLYCASFGPACCLADRGLLSADRVSAAYPQIVHVMVEGPPLLRETILGYASLCGGEETATEVYVVPIAFAVLREWYTRNP
jgi:hypothetical protein